LQSKLTVRVRPAVHGLPSTCNRVCFTERRVPDDSKITIQRGFCTGRRLHAWLETLDHDLAKASVAKKTTLDRYFLDRYFGRRDFVPAFIAAINMEEIDESQEHVRRWA
jgi:hypothetical protein